MSIDNIVKMLNKNNIPNTKTQGCDGGCNINLTYNLKTYRIEINFGKINLLEFNLCANNRKRKNKYRLINSYTDAELMIAFIKNRFILQKAI